jgi:hypothetical protein
MIELAGDRSVGSIVRLDAAQAGPAGPADPADPADDR